MTAALRWEATDSDTADLLSTLADPHPIIGADVPALFLDACRRDAMAHDGLVSVNRVRALLADADIEHHRYSALWSAFTGRDKPMEKARRIDEHGDVVPMWETCKGSPSGNNGRPYPLRRWRGEVS